MKHLLLTISFALLSFGLHAYTPKGALGAIAISHDGAQLVAAGDNRVLYVLDPESFEVKQRNWIEINPIDMVFSKDGQTVVALSTDPNLYFYNTSDWSLKNKIEDTGPMAYAAEADKLVYTDEDRKDATISIVDMATAKPTDVSFKVGMPVIAVGVTPDASLIAVLGKPENTEAETKERPPRELRGAEKITFKQQNDGKAAKIIWYNHKGEKVKEFDSWFSISSDPRIIMPDAENLYVINYSNENAHIVGEEIKIFELSNSFNYGQNISPNQQWIGSGGLRRGSVTAINEQSKTFEIDSLPSWPEYFEGFAVSNDGTIYGGTSAYRLVKVPLGQVEKTAPIH